MRNIIITSTSLDTSNPNNNTFRYKFPVGAVNFKNNKIALQTLNLYYSNFNVSTFYNNKSFAYVWVDGSTNNVVLPDGYYSVSQINDYLQFTMINNKHYLLDGSGNTYTYLNMAVNQTYYSVQLNELPVPSVLPSGWTLPPSPGWSLPVSPTTPQFSILNNGFKELIGFNVGLYPASPSNLISSQLSQNTPKIEPTGNIYLVRLNCLNNNLSTVNNVLFSFSFNTTFGSLQSIDPFTAAFNPIVDGIYTEFILEIVDQFNRPVKFEDESSFLCILNVSEGEDNIKLTR